jgi:hypothetical protein
MIPHDERVTKRRLSREDAARDHRVGAAAWFAPVCRI